MRAALSAREHRGHGGFVRRKIVGPRPLRTTKRDGKIARRICVKNARMHVTLARDRAGVSEPRRHDVDGLQDPLTGDPPVPRRAELGEGSCREHCPRPRPEVFRCHVLAGYFSQVGVHIL